MADKIVRIGGGSAFYGDSTLAPHQLIAAGVDYLILDYLAEATMSLFGKQRAARPEGGYARDFTEGVCKEDLTLIVRSGVKIVTNAGGVNPHACRARVEELAAKAGVTVRIAVIDGDDVCDRLAEFAVTDVKEMFSGAAFPDPATVTSANAYMGAFPIARALGMGADIVITGRVVDSALTLGPLIHEFGWQHEDYNLLAAGSLAGHVIECGAQATGGLFTDWERVPDWTHIGYPIIECRSDGGFVLGKPEGTGGLIEPATVAEQIVYEVGDPQAYMLPDVVCDFTEVKIKLLGPNRVDITGAIGYAPTGTYKATIIYTDGWRCCGLMPVVGRDAAAKAQRQADALLARLGEMLSAQHFAPFHATRVELIGTETSYGANARVSSTREVLCKVVVDHIDQQALRLFLREYDAPVTSMAVGSVSWLMSRPEVFQIDRVFSITVDPASLKQRISFAGKETEFVSHCPARPFALDRIRRPHVSDALPDTPCDTQAALIDLAWGRSGDKGNSFNVGIIARRPEYLPYIRAALTEAAVFKYFAHDFEGARNPSVTRYEIPSFHALNFLCKEALGGGQRASLRLDPLAKAKAQQLLDFPIPVPKAIAQSLRG